MLLIVHRMDNLALHFVKMLISVSVETSSRENEKVVILFKAAGNMRYTLHHTQVAPTALPRPLASPTLAST